MGGALALVEDGDLLTIDIPSGRLELTGTAGVPRTPETMEQILADRRKHWKKPLLPEKRGILKLFTDNAGDVVQGASMFR